MMKKQAVFVLVIIEFLVFFPDLAFGALPPPFSTPPYDSDTDGASASRASGGFFPRISRGQTNVVYWIGTDSPPGFSGSLTLRFNTPFTDRAGNDFAVLTGWECWGELADQAEFKFYRENTFIDSFSASLGPNAVFAFDLPGCGMVADRIVITNITPDPPGANNLATMEFRDAGIAYVVPEPATLFLLGLGGLALLRKRRT
jgi:hypothetical protein